MPEIRNSLSPGEVIGSYEILGLAGAGGMGVVYKALDRKLRRSVALKFLPPWRASTTKEKERFLNEARAASALDHPNIGVIYGIEESSDGASFIVMAFYEGESLSQTLRDGAIRCEKAIDIGSQICVGLDHAHNHKIVHRDIKPSNVMVTPEGVVKIVDFGLARLIKPDIPSETGATAGTVCYMSPEQTVGRVGDERSDIWAWGVVFAEMLTRQNPFWLGDIPGTVKAILSESPRGIESVPKALRPIIYRCLSKDPFHRYRSCSEIQFDLDTAKKEIPSSMQRVDLSAPTRSFNQVADQLRSSDHFVERARTRTFITRFAAIVLVILLVSAAFFWKHRVASGTANRPNHIAVLPFETVGNDSTDQAVAEGLTDTLSAKLSNLGTDKNSLWVVPASEVRHRNINDPPTALRDVGATLAVTGSYQRRDQSVRLTAHLIDTRTLRQIGSVALENNEGDLSSLEDEAIRKLASLMDVAVRSTETNVSGIKEKPAAYEEYLESLGFMQRYDKPGNLDLAIKSLEKATASDPRFALAYAQLGEAYRLKYQLDRDPKWLDAALLNCRNAAEIDNRVTAVYVTLGRIHEMTGKHDLAIEEFQRALDVNPRDVGALGGMARSYENAGHLKQAEDTYKEAVALRPDYWDSYGELGLFYHRQGRNTEAIAQLLQAISLTPDNAQLYANLGAVYSDTGDPKLYPKAEEALKKSLELAPTYAAYANLGNLYNIENRYADSAAMTERALQLNSNDYLVWNNLITAYEWLHETEKVKFARKQMRDLLEKAVKIQPQDALAQSLLAISYAEDSNREKALVRIEAALALEHNDPGIVENIAIAYEKLGQRSQAIKFSREAVRMGEPLTELRNDPDLQEVIADPRFSK